MASATTQAISPGTTVSMETADMGTAYRHMVAWLLIFVLLFLLNRTRLGHTVIYYMLILAILFLLLTQASAISSLLMPLKTPTPGEVAPSHSSGGGASSGSSAGGGSF